MEVAKTFDRDGVRYRPGDTLPEGLDKQTLEHYKRHGMVREAKPSENKPAAPRRRSAQEPKQTKPAAPRRRSAQEPKQTKPAGPPNTTGAVQTLLDQGAGQTTTASAPPPESATAADSAADDASAADASASSESAPGAADQPGA